MQLIVGLDASASGSATIGGKRYSGYRPRCRRSVLGTWVAGRSRVIALTTFDLDKYAYSTLRAGASGFLLKDALPGRLPYGVALTSP